MSKNQTPGARRVVPRSRGALSGFALIVLGLWGALIPFIGPYFNFSFTPDDAWHWTSARGWLEVLPGVATFVAGALLLVSKSRTMTLIAAWLGVAAGAWFAVGPQLQDVWGIGSPGQPAGSSKGVRALESLALFTLLGVVIVYFAAAAFGRLSVVSLRDAHAAERREAEAEAAADAERERQLAATRDREAAAAREQEAAAAAAAHEQQAAAAREQEAAEAAAAREQEAAEAAAAHERAAADHEHDGPSVPVAPRFEHADDDAGQQAHDDTVRTRGAHAVTEDDAVQEQAPEPQPVSEQPQPVSEQPQPVSEQPQQVSEQPQQVFTQPQQGYAQPQQYDPQHGYGQQPAAEPDSESDAAQEGLGRRLFHRR